MKTDEKTSSDPMPSEESDSAKRLGLKARRAIPKDVGRGFIRIDPRDMDLLACVIGDVVSIKGAQTSVARLMPTYISDRGKGVAFLDGLLRENAAVGLEEIVTICKVEAKPAQVVTLTSLSGGSRGSDAQYLAQFLEGLAIVEGDRIRADFNASSGRDFRVTSTTPKGPVLINAATQVVMQFESDNNKRGGSRSKISYEDIGGLAYPIGRIREMIELPLKIFLQFSNAWAI